VYGEEGRTNKARITIPRFRVELSLKFPIPRLLMETGNFNVMERLGLQFPVSEFEPQIPDSTTFDGNWEFQRHGKARITIPSFRV
jgi:hypothetical protein